MPLTREQIAAELESKKLAAPMPPCADVLLSLVNADVAYSAADDVQRSFLDYFAFGKHEGIVVKGLTGLDPRLVKCLDPASSFPPQSCMPSPCVTLQGVRHRQNPVVPVGPSPDPLPPQANTLRRLFAGDVAWLFYMERMGLFKILGALLDDYALKGSLAIEWTGEAAPAVLEIFTRQVKMGTSSTVRDRDFTFRRVLGWTSEAGRGLGSDAVLNREFNEHFTRLCAAALQYYNEKRLGVAIQASATPGKPSVATLTTIGELGANLRRSFEGFLYGRNYLNTINGIVYAVGTMGLVKGLRDSLGIPKPLSEPHEYLGAAYDILVAKTRPGTNSNRFIVHRDLARSARDILLQLEVVNLEDRSSGGDLETWLGFVEDKFETYRTNYRVATGVDLGAPGAPTIEQAA